MKFLSGPGVEKSAKSDLNEDSETLYIRHLENILPC